MSRTNIQNTGQCKYLRTPLFEKNFLVRINKRGYTYYAVAFGHQARKLALL